AEQEGQQTETEATGAPQKHHYTLNQQVGSITLKCICGKDFYFLKRNVVFSLAATSCSAWVRITDKLSKAVGTQR
ncbi:hypothetical protein, partial [Klebsiella pneumoniae]|uniref:hypothetical protein n=1 Tax=Klebsiella pneumoniae TaxID=573 RepID=UPI001C7093B0